MIKKEALQEIRSLCTGEIEFIGSKWNKVSFLLPYSDAEFDAEIEGDTTYEQVESFKNEVNWQLEQMMDHLGDCKL